MGSCKEFRFVRGLVAELLASFIDPRQALGPDKVIPPEVHANAKVQVDHVAAEMY